MQYDTKSLKMHQLCKKQIIVFLQPDRKETLKIDSCNYSEQIQLFTMTLTIKELDADVALIFNYEVSSPNEKRSW